MKKIDSSVNFPKLEEEVLKYWDEQQIFEKSVGKKDDRPEFVFYDGPPFATGLPHYGHLLQSIVKDIVPRYKTMRGFRVERKWGWDCHGLPIENLVEKEFGFKTKKEIEYYGIDKFNEACRSKVLEFSEDWKKYIRRLGRFVDMENAYFTMSPEYMGSVWWVFKQLWDKGLIYESYRTMHICPRCETTLAQAEVSEGYKDVKDLAVTAKFELADEPGTFVLAWTTTPWTLPGNVALAVNKNIEYVKLEVEFRESNLKESYIVAKDNIAKIINVIGTDVDESTVNSLKNGLTDFFQIEHNNFIRTSSIFKGSDLLDKAYKPIFDYYAKDLTLANHENGWKIYHADFVTTEMGTGIAHEAPAFGEDDMLLGKQYDLPWVQHVKIDGTMKDEVTDFAGQPVKPLEDLQAMDVQIIKYLAKEGLLFSKEKYEHSYPHCWRCDTPLLNYATSSWFVAVEKIKEKAIENAKKIHWSPEHIKTGRFGKWLEGARDWSISRQRFWASVMPLWKCPCGEMRVFGSAQELEEASGQKVADLHKHIVDEITVACEQCQEEMHRVPDVLDTWFDSGSMPYASQHFLGEGKLEKFPADFIAEMVEQTRTWFYYQHILGTALYDKPVFKNALATGVILAEDGKKMSKKLNNYPDPLYILDTYGADAVRFYIASSPVIQAENLNFSEKDLQVGVRNNFRMLWNSYSFFTTYAVIDGWSPKKDAKASTNILDRWLFSELQLLIAEVTEAMDGYQLARATRAFTPFIDNLSNWYVRRSRKRFWKNENDSDKEEAYQTLYDVLVGLSKLMAPFTPFISEEIYRNLTGGESVHLADWPEAEKGLIDGQLNEEMAQARLIVTTGLKWRAEAKFKVRQPLLSVSAPELQKDLQDIVLDELNVKEYKVQAGESITLDGTLTPALKLEGKSREIIRAIQEGRKKAGFNVEDRIMLGYQGCEEAMQAFEGDIAKEVLATSVELGELIEADYAETVDIEGEAFSFTLKRP